MSKSTQKEKEAHAWLEETINSECPYCGAEYCDKDVGWRDKPQEDGYAFNATVRCQKTACGKTFILNFNCEQNEK